MKIIAVTILLALFVADFGYCCRLNCAAATCKPRKEFAAECVANNQAYVPPGTGVGYWCSCCGRCANVEDVVDPSLLEGCDPNRCKTVRCAPQNVDECTRNQVYAPADGLCFCCSKCAKAKRFY